MFTRLDSDRKTIERKYHDPDKEFDAFNRMAYHGYDYDEASGLSDEEIDLGLAALSAELEGKPHPIHKAALFAYVLDHTRIDVSERDYFVGIYTWGRPLSKYTVERWRDEIYAAFPEESRLLDEYDRAGMCFGWLDFDHTVPDWDSLMRLGFKGILDRAERQYASLAAPSEKQTAFFEGMRTEYRAVLRLIDRLFRYASERKGEKTERIAACLKHLRDGAPTDTYEALQLIYLYFMISESIEHYQVRSLGHGLDSTLYPFYKADIESGRYTRQELGELVGYFLLQWSAIGNYWGQPFYLGGMDADGRTRVTDLSYLILDVYDRLGLYNPKIQIKVNQTTPRDFVRQALDMIRGGNSSVVFCSDDAIVKCMMARGATYEEAVDAVVNGCYEYKLKAKEIGVSVSYFNALKPILLVLDNGFDRQTGLWLGPRTGELAELDSFDRFYSAYREQLSHAINAFLDAMNRLETRVSEANPSLLFSATCAPCVQTMTDALDGGLENTTDFLLSGLASAVDSLMAVRELVYEKRILSLAELKEALDADWVGHERVRRLALSCCHKYGNGDAMADSYAAAIARFVYDRRAGKKNALGGRHNLEMHSARAFIIHGEKTGATPDGRRAGEETSKNASPVPGADRNGITAQISSATAIDSLLFGNGFCMDAMLHPSAVAGEDGMTALHAVLDTYIKKGGQSIHFNIFSADILRDAQEHPERYRNLQVRVCGWNVLWSNMSKKEQDAYILRAENIK